MVSLNLVYFVKGPVRFTDHQLLGEVPKFSTGICPWTPLEDFLPSVSRRTTRLSAAQIVYPPLAAAAAVSASPRRNTSLG